jgi:DNA-binding NtrC family response regulator
MPPLARALDDVPRLVEHFVARFSRQYQVAPKRVAAQAMERLQAYVWPGNVRELQNAIERAFALAAGETNHARRPAAGGARTCPRAARHPPADDVTTLEDAERRLFAAALRKSGGTRTRPRVSSGSTGSDSTGKLEKYGLS